MPLQLTQHPIGIRGIHWITLILALCCSIDTRNKVISGCIQWTLHIES